MNNCTGQLDGNSAGFASRGNENIFKNNSVQRNAGAGFYFGSNEDGYGINNIATDNRIYSNVGYAFNIQDGPQRLLCGNDVRYNKGIVNKKTDFDFTPTVPCR